MNKTAVFDEVSGKLNQGPVILKLDAGPGRIVASAESISKREDQFERGLIIMLGLPRLSKMQGLLSRTKRATPTQRLLTRLIQPYRSTIRMRTH